MIHPDFAQRTGVLERLKSIIVLQGGAQADALKVRAEKFNNLAIANKNGAVATKCSLRYRAWERDPTSDARVIRFCLSVPIEQYVKQGTDRSLIRRATSPELPDKVRLNQRVRGYNRRIGCIASFRIGMLLLPSCVPCVLIARLLAY